MWQLKQGVLIERRKEAFLWSGCDRILKRFHWRARLIRMLRQHCSSDYCQRLLREQSIFYNMLSRQPWQSVWTDIVPRESLPLASSVEQRQPTVTGSRLGGCGVRMGIQVAPSEADSRALTAEELASRLERIGEERYHHQSPFHLLMHEGRLTHGQLQAWALTVTTIRVASR